MTLTHELNAITAIAAAMARSDVTMTPQRLGKLADDLRSISERVQRLERTVAEMFADSLDQAEIDRLEARVTVHEERCADMRAAGVVDLSVFRVRKVVA